MPELPNSKVQEILKQEREKKKLSLEEIHQKTKISISCIKSIEAGEWSRFTAPVYLVSFLRKYANCVGLNPNEIVSLYESEEALSKKNNSKVQNQLNAPKTKGGGWFFRKRFLFLLALSGLLLFLIYAFSVRHPFGKLSSSIEASTISKQSEGLILSVKANEVVWVRVLGDGALAFQGFLASGKENSWKAVNDFVVRIGKVGSVEINLNGKPVSLEQGAVNGVNEAQLTSEFLKNGHLSLIKNGTKVNG